MEPGAAERHRIEELLRSVPLFAELGAAETEELCRWSHRLSARPGDLVIAEGTPGDALYVILSGELQVTKRDGGREIVLASRKAGDFLGEMSLLEQSPRTASARVTRDAELLVIGADEFHAMLERRPSAARTILRTIAGRLRSTEASLVQSDRLASLGTLAAGLAHELNNPAAAIQRSSAHLGEAFETWRRRTIDLQALTLNPAERDHLCELEAAVKACSTLRPSDAASGAEENRLVSRLESLGITEPWEIAYPLLAYGFTTDRLDQTIAAFEPPHLDPLLQWLGAGLAAQQLMEEIRRSAQAISDIVHAVKSYTFLDQAPVQDVDLPMSLEDTLMILRHKLKYGIEIVRDFESSLPRIEAYAGELNQVWTNIIDNAVQAMDGHGTLELGARRLGDQVEVTIADSGPGIPPEVASRVFEPFFTTKAQGIGTGLGLHIAHNIVVHRHGGRIGFTSAPGRTEFRVTLPLRLPPQAPAPGPEPALEQAAAP